MEGKMEQTLVNILLILCGIFYSVLCIFSIVTGLMYASGKKELNPLELSDEFMSRYTDQDKLKRFTIKMGWVTFLVGIVQGITAFAILHRHEPALYWIALGFTLFSIASVVWKLKGKINAFPVLKCIAYVVILEVLLLSGSRSQFFTSFDNVDYADPENWAYYHDGDSKAADVFLLCPTVDVNDEFNMSMTDERTKASFLGALNMERGLYEDAARLFAPYYRQAAMKVYSLDAKDREQYLELAYADVSAAFAYYLEHENQGRPIILAGFSQGADMCYRLLKEYFGNETLYSQLVAAYALGWPCTKEMVLSYPQIVPASGSDDIGAVISFDCEAPEVSDTFIYPTGQQVYSINPLNWKTDATPAVKEENLGACFTDYSGQIRREEAGLCGCYIDKGRGVVKVTDIESGDYPASVPGLPQGAYHIYDYQFFFRNLQQNVADRLLRNMQADRLAEQAAA